jgi:hypothetical protein
LLLSERCSRQAVVEGAASVNVAGWRDRLLFSRRPIPVLGGLAPFAGWMPYKRAPNVLVAAPTLSEADSTYVAATTEKQTLINGRPNRSVAGILSEQFARIGKAVPNLLGGSPDDGWESRA